jgi:hypothetical protein
MSAKRMCTWWRQNLHFIAGRAFVTRAEAMRFIAGPRHQKVAPPPLAKRFLQICEFRTLSLSLVRTNGERGGH